MVPPRLVRHPGPGTARRERVVQLCLDIEPSTAALGPGVLGNGPGQWAELDALGSIGAPELADVRVLLDILTGGR